MDVFKIPIIIKTIDQERLRASLKDESCIITLPQAWLDKDKYTAVLIERAYWQLIMKVHRPFLADRTAYLNNVFFGFSYNRVNYHRQFRRWGSCSSLKNLNFSHRLIGAPQTLVDYVIIHELVHLKHMNHGRDFWSMVQATAGNPKIFRKEIIVYGEQWRSDYQLWCKRLLNLLKAVNVRKVIDLPKLILRDSINIRR